MAKESRKYSGVDIFGFIVIALGIILGSIISSITVAAAGIGTGISILLIGVIVDRLDIIIDLLRQIVDSSEHKEQSNPGSENKS